MYFNTLLPSEFIDNLKCSICKNYLSYFPIHITKSKENVCGRCVLPKANIHMRNDIYEVIAKKIEFPCRYSNEGCFKTLFPKDISHHERVCPYRLVQCPTVKFTKCTANVSYPTLAQHCEDNHPEVILKNGEFEIDLTKSSESNHLLLHNGCFFLFERKFDLNSNKLRYSFACVESQHNLMSYFYELVLQNESRTFSVKGFVGNGIHEGDTNKINLDLFISNSYYEDMITGKILLDRKEVESNQRISVRERLLTVVKCSSCLKYIKPGETMYWIDNKTTRCGSCGVASTYSIIYNFSIWDILSDQVHYPCPNQNNGCDFVSNYLLLKDHELSCPRKDCSCPLSEYETCNWNGLCKDVVQHIADNHSSKIIPAPEITENVANFFMKCYIIEFATNFFRLLFQKTSAGYYWAVQVIGVCEQSALKFQVQVLDTSIYKNDKLLVTRQVCVPLTKKNVVFSDANKYCYFTLDQVKPLLNSDNLTFVLNIFK